MGFVGREDGEGGGEGRGHVGNEDGGEDVECLLVVMGGGCEDLKSSDNGLN